MRKRIYPCRFGEHYLSVNERAASSDPWTTEILGTTSPKVWILQGEAGSSLYLNGYGNLNSEAWQTLTDMTGICFVCDNGVYWIDDQTDTWRKIASEAPYAATSLAIVDDTLYIGKNTALLRFRADVKFLLSIERLW